MKIVRGAELEFVPASHEDPNNPGVLKKILLKKDELKPGRVQMINWAQILPGKSFRKHYHEDMEEVFVIIAGEAKMVINGEEFRLQKGDAVIIGHNEEHEMENVGNGTVDYVVVGISGSKNGKSVVVKPKLAIDG